MKATIHFRVLPPLSSRFCVHDLIRKTVNDTEVGVYVLDSSASSQDVWISCILQRDCDHFLYTDQNVQINGYNSEYEDPYLPFETELCIAKCGTKWYRCMFLQLTEFGAKVYSIDYDLTIWVDVDDIRVSINEILNSGKHILISSSILQAICRRVVEWPVLTLICELMTSTDDTPTNGPTAIQCKTIEFNGAKGVHILKLE